MELLVNQLHDRIEASLVGHGFPSLAGAPIPDLQLRTGHHRTRGVGYCSVERTVDLRILSDRWIGEGAQLETQEVLSWLHLSILPLPGMPDAVIMKDSPDTGDFRLHVDPFVKCLF